MAVMTRMAELFVLTRVLRFLCLDLCRDCLCVDMCRMCVSCVSLSVSTLLSVIDRKIFCIEKQIRVKMCTDIDFSNIFLTFRRFVVIIPKIRLGYRIFRIDIYMNVLDESNCDQNGLRYRAVEKEE